MTIEERQIEINRISENVEQLKNNLIDFDKRFSTTKNEINDIANRIKELKEFYEEELTK